MVTTCTSATPLSTLSTFHPPKEFVNRPLRAHPFMSQRRWLRAHIDVSVGIPFRGRRAGRKMRVGCPPTPMVTWAASPHVSLEPGSKKKVRNRRYQPLAHTTLHLRTLGKPAPTTNRKKSRAPLKTIRSKPV